MACSSSRALTRAHLETFLLENSFTRKFYVEYGGYLTNHLAHAAIALYHLRASVGHLEGFAAAYVRKLEPPNGVAAKAQCEVRNTDLCSLDRVINYLRLHFRFSFRPEGQRCRRHFGEEDQLLRAGARLHREVVGEKRLGGRTPSRRTSQFDKGGNSIAN